MDCCIILQKNIQYLKGIGPKKAAVLKNEAGIETIEDLLHYKPRRYIDRSLFLPIRDCFVNEIVTVSGTITAIKVHGRNRRHLEVVIDDGTDTLSGIFWGGISYFTRTFKRGDSILFSGKVEFFRKKQIVHPDFDFLDESKQISSINTARIVPLYPSTEKMKKAGMDSRGFRRIIRTALESHLGDVEENLAPDMLKRLNLMPMKDAIQSIHFPDSFEHAEEARKRLSFNELFFLQFYLQLSREVAHKEHGSACRIVKTVLYDEFVEHLPFSLTSDQESVISEIKTDMENPHPMNRLLQGDVGSGKTVVAIAAALFAANREEQTALMAPTEVLANQHNNTFLNFLSTSNLKVALLTGSTIKSEKNIIYDQISNGSIDIIIGTHALIQDEVSFKNLGLIIIDEQHRFGVNQRACLRTKGESPDLLIMTATPIPRSLTLTLYGDLDTSYIREKPQNRLPIETHIFSESRLPGVYNSMEKYISQSRQIYYVLPIIEESEKMDLKSATETYQHLKSEIFPHRRIELLHGRIHRDEKDDIMLRFKKGEVDILVTTTVIEVGIDVANATVMIIEHAERFGLSQLHQLRGRIGRGEHQSYCILIHPDKVSRESKERIKIIEQINDGFKISEEDLRFRGAGEILGMKQHGHFSGFEFVDLKQDIDIIISARAEAGVVISKMKETDEQLSVIKHDIAFAPLFRGMRTRRILAILS